MLPSTPFDWAEWDTVGNPPLHHYLSIDGDNDGDSTLVPDGEPDDLAPKPATPPPGLPSLPMSASVLDWKSYLLTFLRREDLQVASRFRLHGILLQIAGPVKCTQHRFACVRRAGEPNLGTLLERSKLYNWEVPGIGNTYQYQFDFEPETHAPLPRDSDDESETTDDEDGESDHGFDHDANEATSR